MEPVTQPATDAEHVPAYLEPSDPANRARYDQLGFEPTGEFTLPVTPVPAAGTDRPV
jgi:hypothetical protein